MLFRSLMGYHTAFQGEFYITPSLTTEQTHFLKAFVNVRHGIRLVTLLEKLPDPLRQAVNLPMMADGLYCVSQEANDDKFYSDYNNNTPALGTPDLYCPWKISNDGTLLQSKNADKSYSLGEWLEFLVTHFFTPWNVKVSGQVMWQSDYIGDVGVYILKENLLEVVTFEDLLEKYLSGNSAETPD